MDFVIKRDGSKEPFKAYKIEDAIKKAFRSVEITYNKIIFVSVIQKS